MTESEQQQTAAMVVGTFHFAGSPDAVAVTDDMLSKRRQQEIAVLVDSLERWKPTKIAVELPPKDANNLTEHLHAYIRGERKLGADEVQQVAFRLAERLSHDRLFPIDADRTTAISELMEEADSSVKERLTQWIDDVTMREQEILESSSVLEYMRHVNSRSYLDQTHEPYVGDLLMVGVGSTFVGAEYATTIYRRNVRMFANLRAIAEAGDRILVLVGAQHARALRELLALWKGWAVTDSLEVLTVDD